MHVHTPQLVSILQNSIPLAIKRSLDELFDRSKRSGL